jgi:peptidoglycan hydrolase-like protein with peptidoglycan-binding domain
MASSATEDPPAATLGDRPPARLRRRLLALGALVLVAIAAVLVITDPLAGGGTSPGGVSDNEYPTSIAAVTAQSLSSQTSVSGTLGYAGDSTIRLPAGTAPQMVAQAGQSVTSATGMLANARSTLSADEAELAQAGATAAADRALERVDCAGSSAAQSVAAAGSAGAGACASVAQSVSTDQRSVTAAAAKVSADHGQIETAERQLATAQSSLSNAESKATAYGQDAVFTALPSAGQVVRRGQRLYAIDGTPTLLLYGSLVATRAFVASMTPGPDVAELNTNLDALGYGHGLAGDTFTSATAAAIRSLQAAHGMSQTGELLLGSVVFEGGAQRVTGLMPNVGVGSSVMPGAVLTTSSTAREVVIALDAAQQGAVKVGDPVTITLPDEQTTPGRISHVSGVASSPQGGGSPTVAVDAVPTDPAATGTLDEAPVNVSITVASVSHALVVPVDALLALAGGGYALEEVAPTGTHHLVAVSTGLFDDADGMVAVTGSALEAGQRVVVPGQ